MLEGYRACSSPLSNKTRYFRGINPGVVFYFDLINKQLSMEKARVCMKKPHVSAQKRCRIWLTEHFPNGEITFFHGEAACFQRADTYSYEESTYFYRNEKTYRIPSVQTKHCTVYCQTCNMLH